ncbi:MBL fold metallo-hydrolase [Actinomadura barringtoniae]|uniref:MBL fold metallo-hydrolase n=1 Tax=Actinomadura barringtoniae TaxID=1427535 RepID=A0A939PLS6_9ACTN|nr:MBL fold metallo-hydrolase [Actinomadura barringtoniae]MBO2454423.1 MBL fold metallo-hydrolase [Actinomadura barringtoniae]
MHLTVLGACGAWPTATEPCSGFLLEHEDFRLLIDLGYATFPQLLKHTTAERVDAVLISHGHPDHCADLNPLLRARALVADPPPPLPVHAPPHALDAVLALDRPGMLDSAYALHDINIGRTLALGPFTVETRPLPHWVPNAGMRITADTTTVAYTGDGGPTPEVAALARDADLLIAEATYPTEVPREDAPYLTSAQQAGTQATKAGAHRLLLTHLWPNTPEATSLEAAARTYNGEIAAAKSGQTLTLS